MYPAYLHWTQGLGSYKMSPGHYGYVTEVLLLKYDSNQKKVEGHNFFWNVFEDWINRHCLSCHSGLSTCWCVEGLIYFMSFQKQSMVKHFGTAIRNIPSCWLTPHTLVRWNVTQLFVTAWEENFSTSLRLSPIFAKTTRLMFNFLI